jgi:hypothetical protein
MKAKNGLLLFTISLVLISCFDAPEFSNTPSIKLVDIYFGKSKRVDKPDSLVIKLNFEDGDGDLGLDNSFQSDPFHNYNYFVATTDGTLLKVGKSELDQAAGYFELNIPPGTSGALADWEIASMDPFDDLMVPYSASTSCTNYSRLDPATHYDSILVKSSLASLLELSDNKEQVTYESPGDYYLVRDTFYVEANPNFYNLEVHMFKKVGVNEFEEFDFTPYCPLSFNGRFPVLTEMDKENPVSGEINYSMTSSAIEGIMGNNIWKLEVIVRDRSLNVSKIASSKEFTLDEIKR